MSRSSRVLADRIASKLKSHDATRRSVERAVVTGIVSARGAEHLYEGLFLAAFTAFETFLEELCVGLLVDGRGLSSEKLDVVPRVKIASHRIARDLVIGGAPRRFADWMPYDTTERRARVFFRGGRPFTLLSQTERHLLSQAHITRNAIAHKSKASLRRFNERVVGSLPLLGRERTPGGFLRSIFRTGPVQRRYEVLVGGLVAAAHTLCR